MQIAFDRELRRGVAAYEDVLARWWQRQSSNPAHQLAYRRIADYVTASFRDSPAVIVDYACGAGNLLRHLAARYLHSCLIGLDASSHLLALAGRKLARLHENDRNRVTLIRTALPDFDLKLRANLVLFTFPNLLPASAADPVELKSVLTGSELRAAQVLTSATRSPNRAYWGLLLGRSVTGNIRQLLRRGGHCIRVEYGSAPRDHMTRRERMLAGFEEGTTESGWFGASQEPWFRLVATAYFRSGVIEDVHHQTRDKSDKQGGYNITVFRAI